MSITDSFKNLFLYQNKTRIVIALLSILTIGMIIQPPHQSVAQLVDLDNLLKNLPENSLDASDVDILDDMQLCSTYVGLLRGIDTLVGEFSDNNSVVCLIVEEVLG
jgi:hypothetical protein